MVSLLWVQLESCWLPLRYVCHCRTLRLGCHAGCWCGSLASSLGKTVGCLPLSGSLHGAFLLEPGKLIHWKEAFRSVPHQVLLTEYQGYWSRSRISYSCLSVDPGTLSVKFHRKFSTLTTSYKSSGTFYSKVYSGINVYLIHLISIKRNKKDLGLIASWVTTMPGLGFWLQSTAVIY